MIVFRCDSSFEIGTGHIVRCLVLAHQLQQLGLKSHFICRNLPGHIGERIQANGFDLTLIEAQESDHKAILSLKPRWLVVDHYQLDESWEKPFESLVPVFAIDDLLDRRHSCQVLLDQNFHVDAEARYRSLTTPQTRLLLGPQFALMKPPAPRDSGFDFTKSRKQVLVFFGGADPSGETLRFVQALQNHTTSHFFQIVVTGSHKMIDQVRGLQNGSQYQILISPPNWPELLRQCDYYFGSGGTVTWERMAAGLPGGVVSIADNQTSIAEDLDRAGYQTFFGLHTQIDYQDALKKIEALLQDAATLRKMSEQGTQLVRPFPFTLIREIFEPVGKQNLQLKVATAEQARFLFELRNDPQTRQMFRSTEAVEWETHVHWLDKKLIEPKSRLYIAFAKGQPCGQFRVDPSGETSVAVAPAFRGQGLSAEIIREGCALYAAEFQPSHPLTAMIKSSNTPSIRSFEKAGFRIFNDSNANETDYIRLTFIGR